MHVNQDAQIWGEQYNRTLSDIFVLQEEIAREIASQLKIRLTGEEKKKLVRRFTQNTNAYHLYLKGRYFLGIEERPKAYKKDWDTFNAPCNSIPRMRSLMVALQIRTLL